MRPTGAVLEYASDDNYPAGSQPWSGQATKINPAPSTIAGGHIPNTQEPAQYENYFKNQLTKFLNGFDAFQVQNWTLTTSASGIGMTNVNSGIPVCYDPFSGKIYVVGNDGGPPSADAGYSYNGVTWTAEALPANLSVFNNCDVNPNTGVLYATSGDNSDANRTASGTWTLFTLATCVSVDGVQYDRQNGGYGFPWCFFGKATGNHPGLWRAADSGVPVAMSLTNAATYTGNVYLLACGPTRKVAIASISAPASQIRIWDTAAFSNAWADRGVAPFLLPEAIAYGATDNIFMVSTAAGKIWTSPDGITWTNVFSSGTWTFDFHCLAVHGSLWLASVVDTSARFLVWSKDMGVTWHRLAYPETQATAPKCIILADDRFMLYSDAFRATFSLRVK